MPKILFLSVLTLLLCPGYAQRSPHEPAFLHDLIALVQKNHIASRPLDDVLSKEIFYLFLQQIDPDKKLFTLDEINELKLSEASLDDELNNGSTHFLDQVLELLNPGVKRAEKYAQECLEQEADLFLEAYLETNPEKNDFVGEADLQKRWAFIIRKQFNEALYFTEIVTPNQSFEESKSIASGKTKLYFRNYFNDLERITYNKLLEMYLTAYVSALDYQSAFLSPESKAAWDNDFNRNFVGIGISIETTIDYPMITEVMLDGPAWKTGKIHTGDMLLKISDGASQLIDVAGMPVAQVLDLLRGEPGSKVKICIRTSKNNLADIEIERGAFSLPKTMSFVLEDKTDHTKVGYLYLPRFYAGEENCSVDVSEELKKLDALQLKGIILDLRDNQGGSASEARKITGYFLKGEPVMQVVYADKNHRIFEDEDSTSLYSGKLVVLVNERSSSASELFSGTLQDYHRAIIAGTQTYGKGTVQRFFEITSEVDTSKFGEVKLSIAKFYTGNGRSIQYNGITPDIIFPGVNMYIKTGERAVQNAMQFGPLEPLVIVNNTGFEQHLNELKIRSQERQAKSDYFQTVEHQAKLKKRNEALSLINLNYEIYKNEKLRAPAFGAVRLDRIEVLPATNSAPDIEKANYWALQLQQDEYLFEAMMILKDQIQQ